MAGTEAGPSDIIIHLVNPYKCSDCGSEFFLKNVFVEHLLEHIDKLKAQNPCNQIVSGVSLVSQQANSITVTRDILQINDNQIFELQDTSVDYSSLTPLRILEQAGILSLPPPQRTNSEVESKQDNGCHITSANIGPRDTTVPILSQPAPPQQPQPKSMLQPSVPQAMIHPPISQQATLPPPMAQPTLQRDLALIPNTVDGNSHSHLLKSVQTSEMYSDVKGEIYSDTCSQNLQAQNINSVIQQPSFIVNDELKEELNIIIEAPAQISGEQTQGELDGIHDISSEDLRGVRSWANADIEAIMSGKHVILVKKIPKPEYVDPKSGRATCKICFNEFANKNVLMRHQVVHTGVKPHCCFTCCKEFSDISSLRKHLLIHKRSHRCPVCLKMFLRRRQLEIHLRQHDKKRFIQFGQKYHEVHVSTSRNEHEQIVHEFTLAALLNNTSKINMATSAAKDNSTLAKVPLTSEDLNKVVNSEQSTQPKDDQSKNTNADDNQREGGKKVNTDSTQTSNFTKKVIYKCGHCKKFIYTRPTLSRHLMIHTNEKPFHCDRCGKQFRHKSDLVYHYKTHSKPVKCHSCGASFAKQFTLNRHIERGCSFLLDNDKKFTILPDLTYQCHMCSKILKTKATIFRHMRIHAFEARKFQESDAKKIAKTVTNLQGLHGEGEVVDSSTQNVDDFIRPLTNSVGFQCTLCKEEFRFKSSILIHVRMHLNQRPFTCKVCGVGFHGRYMLRKHQNNHTRPFRCPTCGKGFNRRYLMTHHFNRHHAEGSEDKMKDVTLLHEKKMISCNICGKTMKSYQKRLMQYHIRLHKDVRPYQCQECHKSFISDIALKKHRLGHKKPYVCQVCGRGFSRRYLMLDHFEKTCRSKWGKMTGQADSLSMPSSLVTSDNVISEQAETGNQCSLNSTPYVAETVTEIDEKNGGEIYRCVPCDKSFTVKDGLLRHQKTFARPTPCKYCSTIFQDKHLTLVHQRSCLGIEINQTSTVKETTIISHSQKKVLKVMEEINKKIENYSSLENHTSAPTSTEEEISSPSKNLSSCDAADKRTSDIHCEEETIPNKKENSTHAVRERTISALKKQNKYHCPECERSFATTRGLKIHAACHVRLYKCEICGEDFTEIKGLRSHLKKSHKVGQKDDESDNNERESNDEQKEVSPMQEKLKEDEDKEKDHCVSSYTGGKRKHDIEPESSPRRKSKASSSGVGSSEHKGEETNRIQKEQKVDVSARLMQSGTRGRPYSCKLCRRRFTEETGLTSHMLQIHGVKFGAA